MILIVTESTDFSTFKVCEWLLYLNKPFEILNELSNVVIDDVRINKSEVKFDIILDNKRLKSLEINTVWFRRGGLRLLFNKIETTFDENFNSGLHQYMINEITIIRDFITSYFMLKSHFGVLGNINKLNVLKVALEVGFNIPDTLITTSREELNTFVRKYKKVISKAISENINIKSKDKQFFYPNSLITEEQVNLLPNKFQSTLLQQYIDKKFEIRVFIIDSKIYPMAIFSQSNKETRFDYRNYASDVKTRCVKINLDDNIKLKIFSLMKQLNMNSGSIDMIYSIEHKYYFLEINPVGQFGNVSYECNYHIEKQIAELL